MTDFIDEFKKYQADGARTDYIPLNECKKGFLYRIHSRNLTLGVWDGVGGFVGVREKFSERYLFVEYHYDTGAPYGTVKPFEELAQLPENISCNLYEKHEFGRDWAPDPVTKQDKPVIRRDLKPGEPQHGQRIGFVDSWVDTGARLPDNLYPHIRSNGLLFRFLDKKEKEYNLKPRRQSKRYPVKN